MSEPKSSVDLDVLRRDRAAPPEPRRRRAVVLVPLFLLVLAAVVFWRPVRDLLTDAVVVGVVRPVSATAGSSSGRVLFQAAGWVEPDPFPTTVPVLAPGVVERVLVLESDAVTRGQPLIELVVDDARLAAEAAHGAVAMKAAEVALARVESENAAASFAAAIDVTAARERAAAALVGARERKRRLDAAAAEAAAAVRVAESDLATQRFLTEQGASGPFQIELADARLAEARAARARADADADEAEAMVATAQADDRKAARDLELRLDEHLRVDGARARLARAEAELTIAETAAAEAELRLQRMVMRSPIDGIVLALRTGPGATLGTGHEPACLLYDPMNLRVRVDVPQKDVTRAEVGLRAEIRCESRRDRPYQGTVLRIVDTADIQKVTLEVQVRIVDPDRAIKPEMLCQVSVFGRDDGVAATERSEAVAIPARCLVGESAVFVVDGDGRTARRRDVEVDRREGDRVIVRAGLNLSDKVIDRGKDSVADGVRLRIEGDSK